jgi:hypothetical protein
MGAAARVMFDAEFRRSVAIGRYQRLLAELASLP